MQKHAIILFPFEVGRSSKTGQFDDTVVLDDTRLPTLGLLLEEQAAKQRKLWNVTEDTDEGVPLWNFSPGEYRQVWKAAVEHFGVQDKFVTPYQNRHGGVSRDRWMKLRSLSEAQSRGRWASSTSLKFYEKSGRLQEVLNFLGDRIMKYGDSIRRDFPRCIQSGSAGTPPPAPTRKRKRGSA